MDRGILAGLIEQCGVDAGNLRFFCDTACGPFYMLAMAGDIAVDMWRVLRDSAVSTGYWPLISLPLSDLGLTDAAQADWIASLQRASVDEVLVSAQSIDPRAWLEQRLRVMAQLAAEDEDEEGYEQSYLAELTGEWPADQGPRTTFTIPETPVVQMHLLPTAVSWHAPAFYRFGGTSTPKPEEHVAVHRYWFANYGAEMVSFRGDLIEMHVRRPPRNRSDALTLAWEHYAYCYDSVVQGSGTIAALATTLLNGTAWYFWWD